MIVIFEGPEKAGKTTQILALASSLLELGFAVTIRKFSGPMVNENQYLEPLLEDITEQETIIFWDRGWVSEYVYSTFYFRDSSLNCNARRAEKVFTSIVDKHGLKYMVLPEDIRELTARRDALDLDIDPEIELGMFLGYAKMFGWPIISNLYTPKNLADNTSGILADILALWSKREKAKTNSR